ncbi:hypothetical protein SB775_29140, partial [Peribacillus sp. SIMBA_075]|uniref:hypothetical protein n=1 Tax=Peribacillus sp. SIMBA_075 TaxID=3085813 RepID=UPI00397A82B6
MATQPDGPNILEENFRMDATLIRAALDALDESWASLHAYARNIKWERLATVKKDSCDPQLAEQAKARRNEAKKLFNDVKDGYFTRAP